MLEFLNNIDTAFFLFLNGLHNPFFDEVMWWISQKSSWYPFYIVLIGYIIYRFRKKSIITLIVIALMVTISDQVSVHLFKDLIQRLRPCHNSEISGIVHLVNDYCGGKYGFISSHASNTFALAVFLSVLFRNKYFSLTLLLWASVVSYSRIYLGVHYPGDVFGGLITGSIIGVLLSKVNVYLVNRIYPSQGQ